MKLKKIAQIGTFDIENFGDLLFPDVLKNKMGNEYEIDLFSPIGGIKPFSEERVFPIESLEQKNKEEKYEAIIIGGGDVIRTDCRICIRNDVYGYSSEPSLELWAYPILLAKKYNIPLIFNSVGITNDFTEDEIFFVKKILSYVDYFTVRDTEAQWTLEKAGIFTSKIVPDSVLTIKDLYSDDYLNQKYTMLVESKIVPNLANYIIFQHNSTNIDNPEYFNNVVKLLREVSMNHQVLLMPIGYIHDDDKVLQKIFDENIKNVYIINNKRKLTPEEMIAIIKNSDGYMGTSMHGAVVSYAYNKKIMILNSMNSKKLHGFANIIGKSNLDVNNDKLLSYIYENYFECQSTEYSKSIYTKIQKHFADIKDVIQKNQKVSNGSASSLSQVIEEFYKNKNNPEMIGEYYDEETGYLNRKLFKYSRDKKNIYCAEIKSNSKLVFLKPSISSSCKPKSIYINGKNYLEFIDKLISDNTVLEINNDTGIIKIELAADIISPSNIKNLLFDEISENKKLYNKFKKLDNLYEVLLSSYKELEKKYCDLLKNQNGSK